jgi:uncharacterized protein with von Willebrand factor type A (vWA) domain
MAESDMDREHILHEIRRTAESNGGVPLGRSRFLDETGIKESDWSGKIWARWSDAVKEAGYEPLKLQGENDRNAALRKISELTRALGRFPTVAEMRLTKRRDPSFPHHNMVESAGGRLGLIAEVADFCRSSEDLSEVAEILGQATRELKAEKSRHREETGATKYGYVYLLRAGKRYKIGHAIAPLSRAMVISNMTPEGADRVHEIRTDDPRGIEEYWHKRFADKRGNGEWFALSAADVAAFKRRKSM